MYINMKNDFYFIYNNLFEKHGYNIKYVSLYEKTGILSLFIIIFLHILRYLQVTRRVIILCNCICSKQCRVSTIVCMTLGSQTLYESSVIVCACVDIKRSTCLLWHITAENAFTVNMRYALLKALL